ncbi:MAG: restriction endonuclease subunit S [Selenomonadaceae bacterium]|nr:restriction endonuclease subunit S [Selenomonadaceae bacterium]
MKYRFDEIAVNITTKKKPTEQDRFNYIGLEHLDSGSLSVSRWGSDVAPKGEKLLMHKGDVLFGKRRAYQKKVAIAPFDGIFSAHGMVLRPNEEIIDKDSFPMFISSDYFLDAAIALSVGSLSPTINWRDLARQEFELPPLDKQRELADVLWSIEDTRTAYQELVTATEELVKSRFIEMFGDPVTNPMGWEKRKLIDVCDKITDGTHFSPESYDKGEYKYVTAKNIKEGGFDFSNITYVTEEIHREIYNRCNPVYGDVLYIKDGVTTGIAMVNTLHEEFSLLSSVALIKQQRDILNGAFLCGVLNNSNMYKMIRSMMGGAAITRLTVAKIKPFQIILPPIAIQNKFADFVQLADKSKSALQQSIDNIHALKAALIREYLT